MTNLAQPFLDALIENGWLEIRKDGEYRKGHWFMFRDTSSWWELGTISKPRLLDLPEPNENTIVSTINKIENACKMEDARVGLNQPPMRLTDKQILKSIILESTLDHLWWKWTTHEGLKSFFGCDNQVELRSGGPFEIYFSTDAPVGLRGSEGCKVMSYLFKERITFSWNAPPTLKEARESGYYTWIVVQFKPILATQTELTITHLGWPEGQIWEEVYQYFDRAWGVVLQWLADSIQKENSNR